MEQTNWRCLLQKVGKVLIRRSRQCEVLLYFSDFATNRDTIRLPSLVNAIREGHLAASSTCRFGEPEPTRMTRQAESMPLSVQKKYLQLSRAK
jgi:hypothetical protein